MAVAQIIVRLPWDTYKPLKTACPTNGDRDILINDLLTKHFEQEGKTNE